MTKLNRVKRNLQKKPLKERIKIGILSLGCPKTLVDSENILGQLDKNKFVLVDSITDCDVALINTCAFIHDAKMESIERILELTELKKQKQIQALIVVGCLPQRYPQELKHELNEVDAFIGSGNYDKIAGVIESVLGGKKIFYIDTAGYLPTPGIPRIALTPLHYRYVKISEGCDHRCAFCSIPSFRGKHRSRPVRDIYEEVNRLVADGAKEIVITGQDTTHYGRDIKGKSLLTELIEMLETIRGLHWLRLLYTHPTCIPAGLIQTMQRNSKLCHYLDLPLQHASNPILKSMRRGTKKERIIDLIQKFRRAIPDLAIRTTFIVGYPGETEKDFDELLAFMKEIKFERLGIFTYSREEGTPAYRLPHQLSEAVKQERMDRAMKLQQEISIENNRRLLGKTLEVLIEARDDRKRQHWIGRTYMDAPEVDGNVYVHSTKPLSIGKFYNVKIQSTQEYDLSGTA